jgi:cystine transport system substrate-binding protein
MRNSLLSVSTLVLLLAGLTAAGCDGNTPKNPAPSSRTVFQRVTANKVIRCGYVTYAPYCIKDTGTGAMSGIFVDALTEIGRRLELKIDWVEEVGYGTLFEGLDSGRYDIIGSGLWRNSSRGKRGSFSLPLFYNGLRVWIRADENRLKTLNDLTASHVRIAVQDAAVEDLIAKTDFPQAQRVAIPQLNPWTDNLLNITSGKADVTFAELAVILPFLKKNPGTLKELVLDRPIRVFATSFAFKLGESEFQSMLDSAIEEILFDGTMENILRRYETAPGEYLRVAKPYEFGPGGP